MMATALSAYCQKQLTNAILYALLMTAGHPDESTDSYEYGKTKQDGQADLCRKPEE